MKLTHYLNQEVISKLYIEDTNKQLTIYDVMEAVEKYNIYFHCYKDSFNLWNFIIHNYNTKNDEPRVIQSLISYDSKLQAYETCILYILDYLL